MIFVNPMTSPHSSRTASNTPVCKQLCPIFLPMPTDVGSFAFLSRGSQFRFAEGDRLIGRSENNRGVLSDPPMAGIPEKLLTTEIPSPYNPSKSMEKRAYSLS